MQAVVSDIGGVLEITPPTGWQQRWCEGDGAAAFMDDIWAEYLGTPNSELMAYFTGLRGRARTGILSNSFVGAREREQQRYGFGDCCDVVVYSHEEGLMKPDPAFFDLVCDGLGVAPRDIAFVDDVPGHVEAAATIGMTGILHRDNATTIAAVERALAAPLAGGGQHG